MFTGIIEEIGTVKTFRLAGRSATLTVQAATVLEDVHLGDSIAVDGVCVTVTQFTGREFSADLMPETVKSTTLRTLTPGSRVNLERAMAAGGRFGGHIVSGHVDGTGEIIAIKPAENAVYVDLQIPPALSRYLVPKGSVTLDGTSLTVFGADKNTLTVSLIPHTRELTTLAAKKVGEQVNVECDLIAKYTERLLGPAVEEPGSKIGMALLQENGFA